MAGPAVAQAPALGDPGPARPVPGHRGPTLTHHLDALEERGLVTRDRDPDNRRVHVVELTDAGDDMFHQLRDAAMRHDQRIRRGISGDDLDQLRRILARLRENVAAGDDVPAGAPPRD